MSTTRRTFLTRSFLGIAGSAAVARLSQSKAADLGPTPAPERPLVISTWGFGKPANDAALQILLAGGTNLDAVEQGIRVVEASSNSSVGLGGIPDAAGVVQLDASIMSGPGHRAGSVGGIEGIRHPISAARRVMEKTPHVMLVGEGARRFALEEGLEAVEVPSAERHDAWWKKRAAEIRKPANPKPGPDNHDTIALLVLGTDGHLAGGCSTSGWGGKLPGRVGDSPIIGGGLYVDDEVGAAGATGLGENVMRYCGSFLVVELMRQGMAPEEACMEAIRRIARKDPKGTGININFIALDRTGRFGAAGSSKGFPYAVATRAGSRVLSAPGVGSLQIGPEGGNRR